MATENIAFQDVVLSTEQIQSRVREIAVQISQQLSGELEGRPLHVAAVLDNGFMFMSDLVRHMTVPLICQFVRLETRDLVEGGHERRVIHQPPVPNTEGSDFLLVDAVLHTGMTMDYMIQQLNLKGARSVRSAVLIDKPEERRMDLKPDFWAFRVSGRFLVGYGLGHGDLYRNLPYVANMPAA